MIDVTQVIVDYKKQPVNRSGLDVPAMTRMAQAYKDGRVDAKPFADAIADELVKVEPTTVRDVILGALNSPDSGRQPPSLDESIQRFKICTKVTVMDEVDLDSGERTLILNQAAKVYYPVVIGRLVELIDPARLGGQKERGND